MTGKTKSSTKNGICTFCSDLELLRPGQRLFGDVEDVFNLDFAKSLHARKWLAYFIFSKIYINLLNK